ncbi:MAG TPA: hypothetical protein VF810_05335 [Patescibacteria group bacterium]
MDKKINIAIVGVGNCASSLVQGLTYYKDADVNTQIPGLMHPSLAGYKLSDIKVVAAFDVNETKVGKIPGSHVYSSRHDTNEARHEKHCQRASSNSHGAASDTRLSRGKG